LRTNKLQPRCERGIFLGYTNDFSTYRVLKINSKIICKSCNVTFNKDIFPSLSNESIDDSSFYFNPFETMDDDDSKEPRNFDSYPNQEIYIGSDADNGNPHAREDVARPAHEIIGDVSPENILTHRRRGEPESFAAIASSDKPESFVTTAANDDTLTYNQVKNSLKKEDWTVALKKEKYNMADYHVWDVIERSDADKPLNCTWVFKIKPESSNQAQEYKARLCVQGFKEVFGKDYSTTFAPTGKLVSLQLLITFALQRKLKFHQIDVKCAFLNAPI
jgi:hypothetical protein